MMLARSRVAEEQFGLDWERAEFGAIGLRQDKSTGTFGPQVTDDVGVLQGPRTRTRSSFRRFVKENSGLVGTRRLGAPCHAA